jgi:hypothetical protein
LTARAGFAPLRPVFWLETRGMCARPLSVLVLFLPLLLSACSSSAPPIQTAFRPFDFGYLPVLDLNVATVQIVDQFVPSGVPPDVTNAAPISPIEALRLMAQQRLRAAGSAGRAEFDINNAGLVRDGDTVSGTLSVSLNVYTSTNVRAGFAQATVTRQIVGFGEDLRGALYALTQQLMQAMNIEFEYQVRRSLGDWLLTPGGPQPVSQAPLTPPPTAPGMPAALAPPGVPPSNVPPPAVPPPTAPSLSSPPPSAPPPSAPSTAAPTLPPLGPVQD